MIATAEMIFDLTILADLATGAANNETEWQERALCAQTDPELFFPNKGGTPKNAKAVCLACPVRPECLEWALKTGQRYGIWGGMSDRQRLKLERKAA